MEETIYLNHKVKCDLEELCNGHEPGHNGEYLIECPECLKHLGKSNYKLYIKGDFSIGFCQRCKSVFINDNQKEKDLDELVTPKFNFSTEEQHLSKINVDFYFQSNEQDLDGYQYLIRRNPDLAKVLPQLKFRYRSGRIIMPFFWKGEVFYYQVRSTLDRDKAPLPYYCPDIDHKPIWINPLNKGSKELIITEGIFGSIAAWLMFNGTRDTIAVQGSYISKYQLWMMSHKSYDKYYLYFDDDGINRSLKDLLYESNPLIYGNIQTIKSKFGDPEDDYLGKTVAH